MVRVGIVGMGIRGRLYARVLRCMPEASLTAICDPGAWQARGEELGVPAYPDMDRMLERHAVDALIIATPDHLHAEPLRKAIEYGAAILMEKPLALSVKEARELAALARNRGLKTMMEFENRWNPPFVEARRSIVAGEIGRLLSLNARLNDTIYVPTQMLKWADRSSPAWFLLSHVADLAFWVGAGQARSVYAVGQKRVLPSMGIDTWDGIQAVVTYATGVTAVFEALWVLPESMPAIVDFQFEFVGEKGAIFVNTHDQMVHRAAARYEHARTLLVEINGRPVGPVVSMLESFVRLVQGREEHVPTLEDGVRAVEVVAAIHRSLEEGRPVTIQDQP